MRVTSMLLAIACSAIGCAHGMTVDKFSPARRPQGVTVSIVTERGTLVGESIEIRDDGLLVLSQQKLRLVPFAAIRTSHFDQMSGRFDITAGHAPDAGVRARLRLVSRFPTGLTPELLKQLLTTLGQTELAGITP